MFAALKRFAVKALEIGNTDVGVLAEKAGNGIKAALGLGVGTAAATSALAPQNAHAVTDYSTLTTAVDWTAVGTSLLAVGAAVISITVVFKGVKLIIKMVRGG